MARLSLFVRGQPFDNGTAGSARAAPVVGKEGTLISQRAVINCQIDVLSGMLSDEAGRWLQPFVRIACHDGDSEATRVLSRLTTGAPKHASSRKTVALTIEAPSVAIDGVTVTIPLRWIAIGYSTLAPVFEGRIMLTPISASETMMTIEGSYKAASPHTGDFAARMALRRAEERAVVSLLSNLRVAVAEAHAPKTSQA